jgi:hypothetical protein
VVEPIINRLINSLKLSIRYFSPDVLSDNLTLAIAVIIVLFWTFFINRYWTYGDVE